MIKSMMYFFVIMAGVTGIIAFIYANPFIEGSKTKALIWFFISTILLFITFILRGLL